MQIDQDRPAFPDDDDLLLLFPIFGADTDDDDDDDTDDDDDDDETDDDVVDKLGKDADDAKNKGKNKGKKAAPASKYVPPSEAEYRRMVAALAKSNQDQRTRRQAALERAKAEGLSEGEAKARADAEEAANNKFQPRIIEYEAKLALVEAGCRNPARLVKLVDKGSITIIEKSNGEHELIGLEDQINSLQDDWPELFGKPEDDDGSSTPPPKPRGKAIDAADRRPPGRQGKSATEKALDRLRGL